MPAHVYARKTHLGYYCPICDYDLNKCGGPNDTVYGYCPEHGKFVCEEAPE